MTGVNRPDAWTTVANWRGYGSVAWEGRVYGQKAHAFRELFPLPSRTARPFEVALSIHPDEEDDLRSLSANGWRMVEPLEAAGNPDRYQGFINASFGEIGVAKAGYVDSRSGWFSDRSACYLAAGRPVLAQDTGFSHHLPSEKGLLAFSDLEEAAERAEAVERDYSGHAVAARRFAEEYLDSDRVLGSLLREVGG